EPTLDETVQILKGWRDRDEAHHRVTITDESIEAAANLSDRYITDRFLADKAIDLIDEAGSQVRLSSYTVPPNLKELEKKLEEVQKRKDCAGQSQEFENAATLRASEKGLREEMEETKKEWTGKQGQKDSEVTLHAIAKVFSTWTGVP